MTKHFFLSLVCLLNFSASAQFDSTGFRYLGDIDQESTHVLTKFADSTFYVLTNTGKRKDGLCLEFRSLISQAVTKTGISSIRISHNAISPQSESSNLQLTRGVWRYSVTMGCIMPLRKTPLSNC